MTILLLMVFFHGLIRRGVLSLAVSSRGVAIVHLHTHPDGAAGVFAARALFGAELIALSPSLSSEGGYILPKPECLFTKLGEIHSKHIYMTLYPVCMTCAHSKKRTLPISNLVVLGWLVAVMAGGSLKALVGSSSSGGGGCTGVLLPDMYYHLDCLCHIIPSRTNVSCSGFPEAYV